MKRGMLLFFILLAGLLLVAPAMAGPQTGTTELTITKLAKDGSVIAQKTVDYEWMEKNLPVLGDGKTHWYMQGPTFDEDNKWDPSESVNVDSRDYGAPKGTDVRDLCDLVGGMSPGDEIRIESPDGFYKTFGYENVYDPKPRQGPMVICWYIGEESITGDYQGVGYPPDYFVGMRLLFYADTSTNPWGRHVFGHSDMQACLDEKYWHYYNGIWPATSGLSVKNVGEVTIYSQDEGPAYGSLTVTSAPEGATVFVDFSDTGNTTNTTFTSVLAGKHTVTVRKNGYLDAEQTVTVPADGDASLHFDLKKATGEWYVDPSGNGTFDTIQKAVDAAHEGDTIIIRNGTYRENVDVDKRLLITSEYGKDTTIVRVAETHSQDDNVFDVTADGVVIRGLTLRDAELGGSGAVFHGTSGGLIEDVRCTNNSYGISLRGATHTVVRNVSTTDCYRGVYLTGGANENRIEGSEVSWNADYGIWLESSHNNIITRNNASGAEGGGGLNFRASNNNLVTNNTVDSYLQEGGYGITLEHGSQNNTIYLNTFQGWCPASVRPGQVNTWNTTRPATYVYHGKIHTGRMGNYFEPGPLNKGYTGTDEDGDGIGDTPFPISRCDDFDYYPLIEPVANYTLGVSSPVLSTISVGSTSAAVTPGTRLTLSAVAYDQYGTEIPETSFTWTSSNETVGTIGQDGAFVAHEVGATVITAASGTVEGKMTMTVARPGIVHGPYITGTTRTETTISWKSAVPTVGQVDYAPASGYVPGSYAHTVTDTEESCLHHVVLTGLEAGTTYHYRVRAGQNTTRDFTFQTFPDTGEPFTFIVYSDSQEQKPYYTQLERHGMVAERIAEEEGDAVFVLLVGDTVSEVNNPDEWDRFFAAGGAMFANTTLYTALGNHENNRSIYYETFALPQWYSFDCGDLHVTVLDSNSMKGSQMAKQTAWFKDDLAAADDARWTVAAFHQPPYHSGEVHGQGWPDEAWRETVEERGVDVIFNGDVHSYQRYLVNGTQYIIAATGGGMQYPLKEEKEPGYQAGMEYILGYERVQVDPAKGTVTMEFVPVAGVSEDSSEITKVYPPGEVFDRVVLGQSVGPDLAPVTIATDGPAVAGEDATVVVTVENIGGTAAGAFAVNLTVDGAALGKQEAAGLLAGERATFAFSWKPESQGQYTFVAVVEGPAEEAAVENNQMVQQIAVLSPDENPAFKEGAIKLAPGWNLVSVPKQLAPGSDTALVFAGVESAGHSLCTFDAGTQRWQALGPDDPVTPLTGVLVYAGDAAAVPLTFDTDPVHLPPAKRLSKGWNLIGISGTDTEPAALALVSAEGRWERCVGYDALRQIYETPVTADAAGRVLFPGKGYWLGASENGTLAGTAV
ncbi:NosD domain-containing protein [Methanofollis formosanus]|nr:NosD domain-containing protein [Methanofollis formosanus]